MTTINSHSTLEALVKSLPFVKEESQINIKAYKLSIVLHSPTQVINESVYAETDEEAIFDATQMAKEWKERDNYYWHAYLSIGNTIIKRF